VWGHGFVALRTKGGRNEIDASAAIAVTDFDALIRKGITEVTPRETTGAVAIRAVQFLYFFFYWRSKLTLHADRRHRMIRTGDREGSPHGIAGSKKYLS